MYWSGLKVLTQHDTVMLRDILMIRTSAYKEEYGDGSKGFTGGINGISAAFKANPIGLAITAFVALKGVFESNAVIADKLSFIMSGVNKAFQFVVDTIVTTVSSFDNLKKALFSPIQFFSDLATGTSNAAKAGYEAAESIDAFAVAQAKATQAIELTQVSIESLEKSLKDKTKSEQERIKIATEIANLEIENAARREKLAQQELDNEKLRLKNKTLSGDEEAALVSALVNGTIKGYQAGLDPLGKGYKNATVFLPESLNTLAGGKVGAPTADIVSYFKNAGSAAAAPLMAVMAKSMGMKLNDPAVKSQWAALGGQLIINATTALEKSGMQFVKDEDLERIVVPAMRRTAQAISIEGKAVGAAFDAAVAEIRTVGAVGTQSGRMGGQGRTNLSGSYRGVRQQAQQFALTQRPSMFTQSERMSSSGKTKKSFQTLNPTTKQWEVATMSHITKSITATVTRLVEMTKPYLGDMGVKITKAVTKNVVDGVKKGAGIASPAKEPMIVGQQFAQGGLIGMKEYVDDFNVAGKQLGAAGAAGLASQSSNVLYGKSTGVTATDKSIRRQQEKLAKQNQMMVSGTGGGKGRVAGGARGPGAGMIGMAATTGVMAASMMGGKVGDTAQQLMMPIMMVSMLFGMMSAPLAAVVSLIGLLAFGIFKLNKAKKDEMKATLNLIDAMGTGTKPMQEFSKFAGTVTATEIMNRRRANFSSPFQIKTGKTTFGESFVASDEGKARVESIQKSISKFGKESAIEDLSNQLIGSVVSGALNYKQARSIAANIGDAIQDYDFSIAVNTKLISMLGPDGENVLKDGITIQTKLIEDQRNRLLGATKPRITDFTSLTYAQKATEVQRAIAGGGNFNESGATVFARMKVLLETQQQMLDVTEVEYSKKIEAAKIAGDLNRVNELILEREKKKAALLDQSKQNYDVLQKTLSGADANALKEISDAAKESLKQAYKDSPILSALATEAETKISKSKLSDATKINLVLSMASQDLDPSTVANILNKFTSQEDIDKILNIMPKVGGKDANLIYALADQFASSDKALEFIYSFESKTPEESRKELEAFNAISQLSQIGEGIDVPILLDYAQSSGASAKISKMLEEINNTSAKDLTLEFAVKTVGQEALDELVARGQDWQMMPEDQRRNFLAASTALLNLKGDPGFIKAYKNWALQAGNAGKTINDFIGYGAYKVTEAKMPDTSAAPDAEDDANAGGGPTGSPLDEIVKKLRDVRKATQELTVGWEASGSALRKLAKDVSLSSPPDKVKFVFVPANVGDSVCVVTGLKLPTANKLVDIIASLTDKLPALSTALIK